MAARKDEAKNEAVEPEENQTPGAGDSAGAEEAASADKASGAETAASDERTQEQVEADISAELDDIEALKAAQDKASDWQDRYMRLHAEWDTYRRRMNEQRAIEKSRANEGMVESLLPVLDDFERTIDYANKNGEVGLLSGVQAVYNKLISILESDGVEVLSPEGEPFDALEAQAVGTVPDESVPDETVMAVYQKGYKLGDKVIRPAMVTVSTGGPIREPEPKDEDEQE